MGYLQGFDDCDAASEVVAELRRARSLFPGRQASAHEGYAVLLEEVDELWDEVKKKRSSERAKRMRAELVQIAAMALRMIEDVCDLEAQSK